MNNSMHKISVSENTILLHFNHEVNYDKIIVNDHMIR